MSDLDVLRENIIQAARAWRSAPDESEELGAAEGLLVNAVDDLDVALKPDPWQLLETVSFSYPSGAMKDEIEAALLWRKENPDA